MMKCGVEDNNENDEKVAHHKLVEYGMLWRYFHFLGPPPYSSMNETYNSRVFLDNIHLERQYGVYSTSGEINIAII